MTDKEYKNIIKLENDYREALEDGNFKKAERIIRFLREIHPSNINYIITYADLLMKFKTDDENEKKRKLNKAEVFLIDKINKGMDKTGELSLKLSSVYLEMKKYDSIISLINDNYLKFKDSFKKSLGLYFLGCAYDNKSQLKIAERYYRESLKCKPTGGCCIKLMYLYYKMKDYKSSRKLFDVAFKHVESPQKLYFEDAKFLGRILKINEAKCNFCLSLVEDYNQKGLNDVLVFLKANDVSHAKEVLSGMINGVNGQFAKLLLALLRIDERHNKEAHELLKSMEINDDVKSVFTELMVLANLTKDKHLYDIISGVNESCFEDSCIARFANIKRLRYDGKYQEALAAIDNLDDSEKNALFVRLQKAKIFHEMLNYEEAEKIYFDLLNTEIKSAVLCSLCDLYLYIGQVKKAKEFVKYSNDNLQIKEKAINVLICEGNLVEAKKRIKENIDDDIPNKDAFYLLRISVAIKERDFKTAKYYFDLYSELSEVFKNKSKRKVEDLEYYIKYNLGECEKPSTYFQRQLVSYSKEDTIKHISTHMVENSYKQQHSVFNGNFSAEEIFKMTKAKFNIQATHMTDKSADIYAIDLKVPVAKLGNKETSYVRVVTIANTDKILTIHPIWMVQDSCLVNVKDNGRQRVRK